MYLTEINGYWYVRRSTSDGKETVAKLGAQDGRPTMYRPELYNDKAENILARLPENSVDTIITDPPYGIEMEWGDTAFGTADELGTIPNDTTLEFLEGLAEEFRRVLAPDSHCYVFSRWDAYPAMLEYLTDALELNTVIVWDKMSHGMGDLSDWAPQHEFILHLKHGEPDLHGERPANVVRETAEMKGETVRIHPTQKPRELIEYLIEKSTAVGETIFDPFGGAYTTVRAAMRTFRRGISCELDPEIHRAGADLVRKQLHDDPEYGINWTELCDLQIQETAAIR